MDGIADYVFVRSLGERGHGELFLAEPPARLGIDDRLVGVKVLSGANNEDGLRRATRELRAFASADSPYLVRLIDAGRQGDAFFYAMELSELGSLESPSRSLSRAEVLHAVADAARGAQALHHVGLVHRAIKPANVLLGRDGARLADLGLVQALSPTQTMTGLGSVGSVEFVEPAMLSGGHGSPASDIWSLGSTLHRALTGSGIYGELPLDDPLLSIRRVMVEKPRLSGTLASSDAALITRCLASDAHLRPATAAELAEELDALSQA